MTQAKIKTFDHSPEWKAKQQEWRERHAKVNRPALHDLGMRIKNGPHTNYQISKATGLSTQTIEKIRKFEHGGMPCYSTIVILQRFFAK